MFEPLPAAPSNLTDAYMSTGINLKWVNNSSKATLVKIEREANSSGTFTQIATVADSITTYTDLTTSSGVTYTYRVRAYNTSGNSGYSNEAAPQNEQPTAVHEQLLSGRTTQLQGESITTAIGRIHFTQEYAGKTKSVAVYSLSGRLLGMKTFNKNNIDLQKDFGDQLATLAAERLVRVVADLASGNVRQLRVEQRRQRAQYAALRLAPQSQQNEIVARQDGVDDLRRNRVLIADDAGKHRPSLPQTRNQVFPQLIFHMPGAQSVFTKRTLP